MKVKINLEIKFILHIFAMRNNKEYEKAYSPTICAERTAIFKAVSEGETEFQAICIVGGPDGIVADYCPPCGVCRQVMSEFCDPDTFLIILARTEEDYKVYTLREMLPHHFDLI